MMCRKKFKLLTSRAYADLFISFADSHDSCVWCYKYNIEKWEVMLYNVESFLIMNIPYFSVYDVLLK